MSLEDALKELQKLQLKASKLESENNKLKIDIENKDLQINSLQRMIFGSRREYTPEIKNSEIAEQITIFENEEEIEQDVKRQEKEQIEEITVNKKKDTKKKKAGLKKALLKEAKIIREEYLLEDDSLCTECSSNLKLVSKKVIRQEIEYTPATFKIKEYVKGIYKCTKCGTKESEKETNTFIAADVPNPILTHSFVSPSLASEVIVQKYYLGVPLYRQEKMWDNKGLVLPRNMMANWMIKINEYYFEAIWELMLKKLKTDCEVLHCDETTIQCNKEPNKKASSNSYMWVLASGKDEKQKGIIFKYSSSRSEEVAKDLLKGFNKILITDGYAGYNNVPVGTHAECWAHARRYFYESVPLINKEMDTTTDGYIGLTYCNKLFEIEEKISKLDDDEKLKIRQEESKSIFEEFINWASKTQNEKYITNKKLQKALTYALNQQKELSAFLKSDKIPLTNSLAERAIRPFAVHRKNWLFADSIQGAKANAVMYSLIESAKLNHLKIYDYIEYLLKELPQLDCVTDSSLEKYLPWSSELPESVLNFEGAYKDLNIE